MKRLDKFILKAFIGPFVAILLVVVFVLMMQFLWLYIDELVGKGLGMAVILEFLMWGTCTILPLALPLATLLASMMTLGQKNSGFLIWLGYSYMTPVTSVAGGLYSIWQNIINSLELYEQSHRTGKTIKKH